MSCNSLASDITSATKTTTVESTDILALVRNSTLYGVTFTSLQTALGVTGQIKPVGSSAAVQILNQPSGNLNYIRNINPTQGMTAVVDAHGNINLKTNLANAGSTADGSGVIVDQTAAQIAFKRMKAGPGIILNESGNSIEIESTTVALTSKTVVVSTVDDFPAPAAGVITLEDNTDYFIADDITTSNRFALGESVSLRGPASQIVKLEYTGTGTMLTAVDPNFRADRVTLSAPTGQLMDISGTGVGILQFIETTIAACDTIGTISDLFLVRFKGVAWQNVITDGLTFGGTNDLVAIDTCIMFLNGGTAYDFGTSLFNNITITNQFLKGTTGGTKFIDGAINSANVAVGGLATVTNNRTDPAITPLTNITTHDVRWTFLLNDSIDDTRPDAMLDTQANALVTTITAVDTPAKINAVWTDEGSSQFISISDGRSTYIGEKGLTVPITVVVSILATGGDKQVTAYIAINGSVITGSAIQTTASGTKAGNATCIWQQTLQPNDYVEVWIENNSTTDDLTAVHAVMRIN